MAVTYAFIFTLYVFLNGAYAGSVANLMAAFCVLINELTPDHKMVETLAIHITVVVALCLGSIYLIYANPLDLLPILSMFIARTSELQNHQQRLRFGYLFSGVVWISYIAATSLYGMFIMECLRWVSI